MSWVAGRKLYEKENRKAKRSQFVLKRPKEARSSKTCSLAGCEKPATRHIYIEGIKRHLCRQHYEHYLREAYNKEKYKPIWTKAKSWFA